jgi:tight adherence protein C
MADYGLLLGTGSLFVGLAVAALLALTVVGERRAVGRSLAAIAVGGARSAPRATPFRQRVAAPALAKFTALGSRLSPSGGRERLVRQLDLAGNPVHWPLDRVLAAKAVGGVTAVPVALLLVAGGGLLRTVFLTAAAAGGAFFLPDLLIYNSGTKRQAAIQRTLPDSLDLLTISVEAGMGFDAAIGQVARNTEGPLAGEFFRVLQEMHMRSRADAFRALGERTTVGDLSTFVSSLVQADKLGIPIGRVLREQSKEMRLKRKQRAEEKAMKVPVKILFPMTVCILPVLFIVVLAPAGMELAKAVQG